MKTLLAAAIAGLLGLAGPAFADCVFAQDEYGRLCGDLQPQRVAQCPYGTVSDGGGCVDAPLDDPDRDGDVGDAFAAGFNDGYATHRDETSR